MAYTHEIEWQFSGTPIQLESGVNTLLERRSDLSIRPSLKSDGRLRINFSVSEPFYQGWAVAQSRPMGTIISLHAMKEYQWSNLESVWAIIVAELRRQGWKIEEWNPDTANHQPEPAAATPQSGGINFGPINSAGDVNINLSHVAGRDQNTTTNSTTISQQASSAVQVEANRTAIYLVELSQLIRKHYSLGELKSLCFELQVEYDDLAGETLTNKVQALVEYLERRGRVPHLLPLLKQQRPNTPWPDTPSN